MCFFTFTVGQPIDFTSNIWAISFILSDFRVFLSFSNSHLLLTVVPPDSTAKDHTFKELFYVDLIDTAWTHWAQLHWPASGNSKTVLQNKRKILSLKHRLTSVSKIQTEIFQLEKQVLDWTFRDIWALHVSTLPECLCLPYALSSKPSSKTNLPWVNWMTGWSMPINSLQV